jgi:hypothetical protein
LLEKARLGESILIVTEGTEVFKEVVESAAMKKMIEHLERTDSTSFLVSSTSTFA